jgi:hypothetical protein
MPYESFHCIVQVISVSNTNMPSKPLRAILKKQKYVVFRMNFRFS